MLVAAVANLAASMAHSLAGFVLAAGLGTRIGALSRIRPKPLLPIGVSTSFDRAVDALRSGGANRVVANASHLAEQVVARGRDRDVEVVVERDGPFGTAGGLAFARELRADAGSSLLTDLSRGNRLESPWLCGAVDRMGRAAGVETPVQSMAAAILGLHAAGTPPARP